MIFVVDNLLYCLTKELKKQAVLNHEDDLWKDMQTFADGGGRLLQRLADTLRNEGAERINFDYSERAELPYKRPPLSKQLLLGSKIRDQVYIFREKRLWIKANRIVTGNEGYRPLIPQGKLLLPTIAMNTIGKLLIATGVRPNGWIFPVPRFRGIFYLPNVGPIPLPLWIQWKKSETSRSHRGNSSDWNWPRHSPKWVSKSNYRCRNALLSPLKTAGYFGFFTALLWTKGSRNIFEDTVDKFMGEGHLEGN